VARTSQALDLERACMPIRRGEADPSIGHLVDHYTRRPKMPFLSLLAGGPRGRATAIELLKAHEALISFGRYRSCMGPIKDLLSDQPAGTVVAQSALARAGIAALEHGLPLDLRPISSGLGFDREIPDRLRRGRPPDPIVAAQKELLRALLLNDRSSWIESERYASGLVGRADRAFSSSLQHARDIMSIDDDVGTYHELRCMLFIGRVLASSGGYEQGMERLDSVIHRSRDRSFPFIEIAALQGIGAHHEDALEAQESLSRAAELAERFGNPVEAARSRYISFEVACRVHDLTEGGRREISEQARMMIESARTIQQEDPRYAMDARANAALWLSRMGGSGTALTVLRGILKDLKDLPDEELESKVMAIGVLAHMRSGDRKKGKRALLNVITKRAIKNDPEAYSILKEAVSEQEWLRVDEETKELFAEEPVHLLERSAADEIIRRAKDAYLNEFGAMLRGIGRITHIEPVMEGAEGRTSFMFSMFNRFSQRMVDGEGVVHSHPSGAAYPSGADLAMFSQFPGINIIIGYPYSDDSMAAYDRLGNRVMLRIVPDSG
jgi:proteasome lid subunit RPN8/RPN11